MLVRDNKKMIRWRKKLFKSLRLGQISTTGFTLLETTVALAVITAAVVGPVYLITRGLFSSSFSKNKLIASNLAQEGIETIRTVRENNIICNYLKADPLNPWDWMTGSDGAGTLLGQNMTIDTSQVNTIACPSAPKILENPQVRKNIDCNAPLIYNNNYYGYGAGQATIFSRCVDVTAGAAEPGIPASDIADVTVTIRWNERGSTRTLVVKEKMFNWR